MSARTTTKKSILVALATLAALSGGLTLTTSPGFAMKYRTLPSIEFGTPGSGPGQIEQAMGLAIDDSTGDVYVADNGNKRVEKFDANGNYISEFTGAETPAKSFKGLYSLAVNNSCALSKLTSSECTSRFPSSGDVYVADAENKVIDVFDSSGKYLSQITGPSSSAPFEGLLLGVAIDPEGNVWVDETPDGNSHIMVFGSTGEFFESFSAGAPICKDLATDAQDDVYAVTCKGDYIIKFNFAGAVLSGNIAPTQLVGVGNTPANQAVTVNMATNHVFSVTSKKILEYGPFAEPYGQFFQELESSDGAIAVNDLTEVLYQTSEHTVSVFPESIPAKILGTQVQESKRTSAVVLAHIDPEGGTIHYRVNYGETDGYGRHTLEPKIKATNSEEVVQVGVEGLAPGRVYHYSLEVINPAGTTRSPDATFTTAGSIPPTAVTWGASNVTLTSATVSGAIDAEGLETSYELDLGTDTTYGTSIYGEAGAAEGQTELSVPLQNLAPGTTYHYRIVAINSDGRAYGADETFTTPAYSAPIVLPSALPLLSIPSIAFPTETGTTVTTRTLTNAQKLANALKVCKKKPKKRRASCVKQAHRRYPRVKKKRK